MWLLERKGGLWRGPGIGVLRGREREQELEKRKTVLREQEGKKSREEHYRGKKRRRSKIGTGPPESKLERQ